MRHRAIVLACWLASSGVWGAELPSSSPEAQGMSSERLARIDAVSSRYIESGMFPGAVTAVARNGHVVHLSALGRRGAEDDRPMPADGLFRMYSSTKVVTAVAVMQLYEQGHFQLSDPVARFVPELASVGVLRDGKVEAARARMTMRQLLTHTSGLSYGIDPNDPVDRAYMDARLWVSKDLDDFAAKVGGLPLASEPGSEWRYSVGMDIAGLVVQRIAGQRFDRYLAENLFKALDMRDTAFVVPEAERERLLPNHVLGEGAAGIRTIGATGREAVGFPGGLFAHGCGSGCNYRDVSLYSGGAGLVSTARDFLRFGEMLRNGGELGGIRILSPTTVAWMTAAHVPPEIMAAGLPPNAIAGQSFGLGVGVLADPVAAGVSGSAGEFYHDGAAGTVFWVDPVEEIVALGMVQVLGGYLWRPQLKTAVYQALTESHE